MTCAAQAVEGAQRAARELTALPARGPGAEPAAAAGLLRAAAVARALRRGRPETSRVSTLNTNPSLHPV